MAVTFSNVNYSVRLRRKDKVILEGVSGFFYPGNLTAIMGPSGSVCCCERGLQAFFVSLLSQSQTGGSEKRLLLAEHAQPFTPPRARLLTPLPRAGQDDADGHCRAAQEHG